VRALVGFCAAALACAPLAALAHAGEPAGIAIEEDARTVVVRVDRPALAPLAVTLPEGCSLLRREQKEAAQRVVEITEHRCRETLAGRSVGARGIGPAAPVALLRVRVEGAETGAVLTTDRPDATIPVAPSRTATFASHVGAGAKHLLGGLDHLLFVAGTAFVARTPRRIALALGAFWVGHALTLVLSALHVVSPPARLVEIGIAASLIWLALAVVRGPASPSTGLQSEDEEHAARLPLVAAGFGLVHGLGFASGLSLHGGDRAGLVLALGGFNLGIELAQIGIVAVGAALVHFAPASLRRLLASPPRLPPLRALAGYAMGGLAVLLVLDRVVG
jgi:hypothetical protein